ncbi:MAG: NAD(P)-dependent oxidoreductase [Chitinophagales bacterium]
MQSFVNNPVVEFKEGDIRDTALLEQCIAGCDYVFLLRALRINACAANQQEGFDVMLHATFNVAELCKKHAVKKVIYSSSASVYGLAQHFLQRRKQTIHNNQTFYGAAKMWGEQLFRSINLCTDWIMSLCAISMYMANEWIPTENIQKS